MSTRIYVGNLPSLAIERDLEEMFLKYGRIRDIMMKNGFAFVEFEDSRDAYKAVLEQNGSKVMGARVIVEIETPGINEHSAKDMVTDTLTSAKEEGVDTADALKVKTSKMLGIGEKEEEDNTGEQRSQTDQKHVESKDADAGQKYDEEGAADRIHSRDGRVNGRGRYPPPYQTRYRLLVTNLSLHFSWQNLKDMMRQAGEVVYVEAHIRVRTEANVTFGNHDSLRRAMGMFQDKEINGQRIKLVDKTEVGGSGGGVGQQKFPRLLDMPVYEYAVGMVVDRQLGTEHFIYKIWPFYKWPFSEIKLSTSNNLRLGQWIKFKLSTTLAEFGNIHSQSWEALEHDPIPTFPCLGQVMIECEIKISTQSDVHKILQTLTSLPNTTPMQLYGKILSNGDLFEQLMKFPVKEQRFVVLKFLSTGEWQLQFIRPKCYQPHL